LALTTIQKVGNLPRIIEGKERALLRGEETITMRDKVNQNPKSREIDERVFPLCGSLTGTLASHRPRRRDGRMEMVGVPWSYSSFKIEEKCLSDSDPQ